MIANHQDCSRSPSNDLESLIDVLPLYGFDTLQLFLNLSGQRPAPRVLCQIGDQLHSIEDSGTLVIQQIDDLREGAVGQDLDLALVDLCERAE